MNYIQIDEYNRLYDFDPNKSYKKSKNQEEKMFGEFLLQYQWEKFRYDDYNKGQHHIYVIFNYASDAPIWVGFLHILECNDVSKRCIKLMHGIKNDDIFQKKVVFIHTINVEPKFRRKGYAKFMVDVIKEKFINRATLMVEATKKGKKFWPAVGFVKVRRTLMGVFMMCSTNND